MTKRFVIAQIKHETNTFSPLPTPWEAFGHGKGPYLGKDAAAALAGTNSPFAAFLDIARPRARRSSRRSPPNRGRRTRPRARPSSGW